MKLGDQGGHIHRKPKDTMTTKRKKKKAIIVSIIGVTFLLSQTKQYHSVNKAAGYLNAQPNIKK